MTGVGGRGREGYLYWLMGWIYPMMGGYCGVIWVILVLRAVASLSSRFVENRNWLVLLENKGIGLMGVRVWIFVSASDGCSDGLVPSDLSYLRGSALCEFYMGLFRGIECCKVLIELIEYSLHEELYECSTAV